MVLKCSNRVIIRKCDAITMKLYDVKRHFDSETSEKN